MIIAFIDESGKPTPKEKTPFVLSAVIIKDTDMFNLESKFNELKAKHFPELPPNTEIHMKDLFHGKRAFQDIEWKKRAEFLNDLCHLIETMPLSIISVVIEKSRNINEEDVKDKMIENERQAFELLIERILLHLGRYEKEHPLLIIIDSTELKHDQRLQAHISDIVEEGVYASQNPNRHRLLPRPLFAASDEMMMLQLADIVSYVIFRKHSGGRMEVGPMNLEELYRSIETKMDKGPRGAVLGYGLKIWVDS